ncbi:hypothetical protein M426DRAFT_266674 [Hypoxylon sp. CI-4A]|nr:hypothetical protein M426DRAFT_266674 [Hypoxylon sp. CI-4A]
MSQFQGVPKEEDGVFQKFITRNIGDIENPSGTFNPTSDRCKAWDKAPDVGACSSFGDEGTTATVNMYGDIMQFGAYLGVGESGMLSADQGIMDEPYLICSRASTLDRLSRRRTLDVDESQTYGLQFQGIEFSGPPKMTYLDYRWPRYEYHLPGDLKLTIQWMVHSGVVLQQCILRNFGDASVEVPFKFRNNEKSMWIRDLDHINPANLFNEYYEEYSTGHGLYNYSWWLMHKLKPESDVDKSAKVFIDESESANQEHGEFSSASEEADYAAVVVSVFLDGKAKDWTKQWMKKLGGKNTKDSSMEIVTAYRMMCLNSSRLPWDDFLIPAELTDVNKFLRNTPFSTFYTCMAGNKTQSHNAANSQQDMMKNDGNPSGIPKDHSSPRDHIEFVIRRNLEHILSVCSIPLRQPKLEIEGPDVTRPSSNLAPVALTCGDMSGHRICISASFFAFQFLLRFAIQLESLKQNTNEHKYIEYLLGRISAVCRGHLIWLSNSAEKNQGCFVANYWATGSAIASNSSSWQPVNSLTDTAYQIIKAGQYAELCGDKSDPDAARRLIEMAGTYAFRLDDHIWIWKALKTIEDNGLWPYEKGDGKIIGPPRKVQQDILRHFTTENETSKKRTLAVTRSSRETRFLFHARDTVMFYGHQWGFFLQQPIWENTLLAQPLHEDNQDTTWHNTLRYALAIMMSISGYRINYDSPDDTARYCLQSLLKGTEVNGLFAGELNEITKEPVLFTNEEDRDNYFHASFEVPYILLTDATRIVETCTRRKGKHYQVRSASPQNSSAAVERSWEQMPQQKQHILNEEAARQPGFIKKTVPFSRLLDSNSIIDMEEEWLYNYPSFLSDEKGITDDDARNIILALSQDSSVDVIGNMVVSGAMDIKRFQEFEDNKFEKLRFENDGISRSLMVDVPKTKWSRKKERRIDEHPSQNLDLPFHIRHRPCNNESLYEKLIQHRNATNAKKRFVWLQDTNPSTAFICYIGSTESERSAISAFFDRHWRRDDYFLDDTTMVLNTWETELHLSFLHLSETGGVRTSSDGITLYPEPGISKVSMGFRFWDDLFDRYWTCHLIEDAPTLNPKFEWIPPFVERDKEKGWRQRKILELYLFEHILSTVVRSTRTIYEDVKRRLEERQGKGASSTTILNTEDYFSTSAKWQTSYDILQAVDEKLVEVELEVSKWLSREKDRGQEKPRWTRNDERKYGGIIKKLLVSTDKQIRNLHSVHTSVESLRNTLTRRHEQSRADISLYGSEDIRLFTYVTVIFLPLGFAASIFSMNGTPPAYLVTNLVVCSIVALVITILALFNAKILGHLVRRVMSLVKKYSETKMSRSVLILGNEEGLYSLGKSNEDDLEQRYDEQRSDGYSTDQYDGGSRGPSAPQNVGIGKISRFWFLIAYIILELPVRRVVVAYDILRAPEPRWTSWIHIVIGVICLPLCVVFWLAPILFYNIMDLSKLLFFFPVWPGSLPTPNNKSHLKKLNRLFDRLRPLRNIRLPLAYKVDKHKRGMQGEKAITIEEPQNESQTSPPITALSDFPKRKAKSLDLPKGGVYDVHLERPRSLDAPPRHSSL